ncbi:hypothetical protein HK102_011903, partial [Quaeritorhiza haematococci]
EFYFGIIVAVVFVCGVAFGVAVICYSRRRRAMDSASTQATTSTLEPTAKFKARFRKFSRRTGPVTLTVHPPLPGIAMTKHRTTHAHSNGSLHRPLSMTSSMNSPNHDHHIHITSLSPTSLSNSDSPVQLEPKSPDMKLINSYNTSTPPRLHRSKSLSNPRNPEVLHRPPSPTSFSNITVYDPSPSPSLPSSSSSSSSRGLTRPTTPATISTTNIDTTPSKEPIPSSSDPLSLTHPAPAVPVTPSFLEFPPEGRSGEAPRYSIHHRNVPYGSDLNVFGSDLELRPKGGGIGGSSSNSGGGAAAGTPPVGVGLGARPSPASSNPLAIANEILVGLRPSSSSASGISIMTNHTASSGVTGISVFIPTPHEFEDDDDGHAHELGG